jgi:hypothetical protein
MRPSISSKFESTNTRTFSKADPYNTTDVLPSSMSLLGSKHRFSLPFTLFSCIGHFSAYSVPGLPVDRCDFLKMAGNKDLTANRNKSHVLPA